MLINVPFVRSFFFYFYTFYESRKLAVRMYNCYVILGKYQLFIDTVYVACRYIIWTTTYVVLRNENKL